MFHAMGEASEFLHTQLPFPSKAIHLKSHSLYNPKASTNPHVTPAENLPCVISCASEGQIQCYLKKNRTLI